MPLKQRKEHKRRRGTHFTQSKSRKRKRAGSARSSLEDVGQRGKKMVLTDLAGKKSKGKLKGQNANKTVPDSSQRGLINVRRKSPTSGGKSRARYGKKEHQASNVSPKPILK